MGKDLVEIRRIKGLWPDRQFTIERQGVVDVCRREWARGHAALERDFVVEIVASGRRLVAATVAIT